MSLSHQKFREIVLQILYSHEISHPDQQLIVELMMNELAVSKKNVKLAHDKVESILNYLPQIDAMIAAASTSYDFDRIQLVTKSILRLGVFELFFEESSIPPKVVIAEGIRLSRKFNSPESASFVNALLDHLFKASLGESEDSANLEINSQLLLESEQTKNLPPLDQHTQIEE